MLLDCGLMFPDVDMLGIDLVLPDFTYLRENADRIEGCIATHGHEDHVGGLSFLLRELLVPDLRLGRSRSAWPATASRRPACSAAPSCIPVADGERRKIGPFDVEFIPVTHSVPHGFATAVPHPAGRDPAHAATSSSTSRPVDGRLTDLARIGAIASDRGRPPAAVRLDQRRRARPLPVRDERSAGCCYDLFHAHEGRRIVIACFASHIHRVQQIADAAIAFDRDDRHPRACR